MSDRTAGPYRLSIWTDPDATDDGSTGGQIWVMVDMADGTAPPADTRAVVTIRPTDRPGPARTGTTSPVNGDVSRQFVALVMDHEGPFTVRVALTGRRGAATVDGAVDATYDLRPARWLLGLYILPFVAVGFLWLKLLLLRRRLPATAAGRPRRDPAG